jgi:hypothetical protein
MKQKLNALHARLQKAQRDLLIHSAQSTMLPPDGILRKIADFECAMSAIELMLEESTGSPSNGSAVRGPAALAAQLPTPHYI